MAYGTAIFTTAQTNIELVKPPKGMFIALRRVEVMCSGANSGNTLASVGFSTQTEGKKVTGHPGIAAGSGYVVIAPHKEHLGSGLIDESLTFTCEAPSGGSIQVNFGYELYTG